jgi:hypothetical protein
VTILEIAFLIPLSTGINSAFIHKFEVESLTECQQVKESLLEPSASYRIEMGVPSSTLKRTFKLAEVRALSIKCIEETRR